MTLLYAYLVAAGLYATWGIVVRTAWYYSIPVGVDINSFCRCRHGGCACDHVATRVAVGLLGGVLWPFFVLGEIGRRVGDGRQARMLEDKRVAQMLKDANL